jgi:hypothetical protein
MYVRVLHGCILHVKQVQNVRYIAFYILSSYYLFRIIFSPSGRVHYVTCIGDRYMLQKLIPIETHTISARLAVCIMWSCIGGQVHAAKLVQSRKHILYQPIWLCALCDLYWEQVHAAKLISNTYYITYDYMIACNVHNRNTYYISPSGCVHYVTCIGNRYMLQNLYRTHIISLVIIWLHVMYISQHILYPSVWLCALCNLYWGTGTCCKLIPKHILYHFWLYDCM